MTQQLYKGALNDACLDLANRVLWSTEGTSSDIAETLIHHRIGQVCRRLACAARQRPLIKESYVQQS